LLRKLDVEGLAHAARLAFSRRNAASSLDTDHPGPRCDPHAGTDADPCHRAHRNARTAPDTHSVHAPATDVNAHLYAEPDRHANPHPHSDPYRHAFDTHCHTSDDATRHSRADATPDGPADAAALDVAERVFTLCQTRTPLSGVGGGCSSPPFTDVGGVDLTASHTRP
jgi:hypothetical protein